MLSSEKRVNSLNQEILKMVHFDHPNVMSLIGVCIDGASPVLIMPYMAKGNVLEYVRCHKNELSFASNSESPKVCNNSTILFTDSAHLYDCRLLMH